ncbi:4-carboxymuconolactone decarboxylase [Novosphingobium chloroacetimidivorans]|uniref:4-carboxymuconolactone decarboxylase n=1 Tax=Novosphingobium chloroacetimidivorans TaxID=1428314 RepID=A0A7W7K8W9_9SPHN|nr:carboxymuconolactone decarboxylase family protein [Novosphingobium chloroacetimidivorans]MBB4858371.1 4-carboxymuconolactone decarboxylase [Novosphingobium chloroacetimidivorans]
MNMLSAAERMQRGEVNQSRLLARTAPSPATVWQASVRDYVFAEIWERPGLDLRSRFLIAISGAASCNGSTSHVDGYVRGALTLDELSLSELREAALHLAVYTGWPCGEALDASISRVAEELDLAAAAFDPIRAEPWDPNQRRLLGRENFRKVMVFDAGEPRTAFAKGGVTNFVFAEMWNRPGLDERARRWITLVGVANTAPDTPLNSHIHAAMASGNVTGEELDEFVLQYAVYAGWPKASVVDSVVLRQRDRVARGLSFSY